MTVAASKSVLIEFETDDLFNAALPICVRYDWKISNKLLLFTLDGFCGLLVVLDRNV